MNENDIIAPTVNLNGTAKEELLSQVFLASEGLDLARKALMQMAPNGRDYQTAPRGSLQAAQLQHSNWVVALDVLLNDLQALALKIDEQAK